MKICLTVIWWYCIWILFQFMHFMLLTYQNTVASHSEEDALGSVIDHVVGVPTFHNMVLKNQRSSTTQLKRFKENPTFTSWMKNGHAYYLVFNLYSIFFTNSLCQLKQMKNRSNLLCLHLLQAHMLLLNDLI